MILLCLQSMHARAQYYGGADHEDRRFRGGIILGGIASQVDGDRDGGYGKVGLHTGVGAIVGINAQISVLVEIFYSQKGSRYGRMMEDPALGPYLTVYQMKLNYIELPFGIRYNIYPRANIGLGGSYNRLLSSQEYWEPLWGRQYFDADTYMFNKNSWDAFLSIGYVLGEHWEAGVRYQRSVSPIREAFYAHPDFSDGVPQLNNLLVLRLAYYW